MRQEKLTRLNFCLQLWLLFWFARKCECLQLFKGLFKFMITIVGFYCYGIVPLVSLERPHHGGRGGGHPEYWGRDGLEVPVEVIHQASTGNLDVFGD